MTSLVDQLNSLLPQTQCTKCGFDGCKPYAQAMAAGQAEPNRCPPGGPETIAALSAVLDKPAQPLDPECGVHQPFQVALIDEEHCIGCTLCIQACPVDAIMGATQKMHTIITEDCTGCELCVEPCPVDCITMVPGEREWTKADARQAKQRYEQRNARLALRHEETKGPAARTLANKPKVAKIDTNTDKPSRIAQALARARAKRS